MLRLRQRVEWLRALNRVQTVGYTLHTLGMYALMVLTLFLIVGNGFDGRLFLIGPGLLLLGIIILFAGGIVR